MGAVLIQAASFLFIILAGYLFKYNGLLERKNGDIISKIILNLTLPATIIISFNSVKMNITLIIMILLGIFINFLLVNLGGLFWKRKSLPDQALIMFGQAGYNIGNFTIPFVQGFLPEAIPFIGSFDTGNALMAFGGNPTLVDKRINQNSNKGFKKTLSKLFESPAFTTYIIMIGLSLFNITIPQKIISVIKVFSSGNSFLAMFMIGLYLELSIPHKDFKKVIQILIFRYSLGILLALFFYFMLPFSTVIRLSLVLLALSPIGTIATINMIKYGNKQSISAFLSSSSIILSLFLMTFAFYLFF